MTDGAPMIDGMRRVLVIDDDATFRELARRLLTAVGLSVVGEADGVTAALAAAHDLRPDGMLVDVRLGDSDGLALARELLALPWGPRVVLTSSHPNAASPDDVRRSGAGSFIPKDELPDAPLAALFEPAAPG
jgi:DNA-binding NarL/FixJ family response regulator